MKKHIIFLFFLLGTWAYGQEYSRKTITKSENTFLPFLKGEVVNKIPTNNVNAGKVFAILQTWQPINPPQGFKVEAFGDENNLEIYFMPYVLEEGETNTKPGSMLSLYFNKITSIFQQPVVADIYLAPAKISDFMGYPVYNNGTHEIVAIHNGPGPVFLPISREEYLTALIKNEEDKQKEYASGVSSMNKKQEIEKAYQELLKLDKAAAEDFKKAMDNLTSVVSQNNTHMDFLESLKKELSGLSPSDRKKHAYYSPGAMEQYGNFSGLTPDNDVENAQQLVKLNYKAVDNVNNDIRLITLILTLSNNELLHAVALNEQQDSTGFELTDDKLLALYRDKAIWKKIYELVK